MASNRFKFLTALLFVQLLFSPFIPIITFLTPVSAAESINSWEFELADYYPATRQYQPSEHVTNSFYFTNLEDQEIGAADYQLTWQWLQSDLVVETGDKVALNSDIEGLSNEPYNNQYLQFDITAPQNPGNYELRILLVDNNNELYGPNGAETYTYTIIAANDSTAPEVTITELDPNPTDQDKFTVEMTATDPVILGAETTGVAEYRLATVADFGTAIWNSWDGTSKQLELTLDSFGENEYRIEVRDSAGNSTTKRIVVFKLQPDTTAPIGQLAGEAIVTNTTAQLSLSATDPAVGGEFQSQVNEYKLGTDLDNANWQQYTGATTVDVELPPQAGTTNYSVIYRDAAGNTSETYDHTFTLEAINPTLDLEIAPDELVEVEGELEAQDTEVEILASATSNVLMTHYRVSTDNDTSDDEWLELDSGTSVDFAHTVNFADADGVYNFWIEVKNSSDQTATEQVDIKYEHYDIEPQLAIATDDQLLGGVMDVVFTLSNSGIDIAYNNSLEFELPAGFSYVEPTICDQELNCYGETDAIPNYLDNRRIVEPTYIENTADGNQQLRYDSIADLLTGESVKVGLRVQAGGVEEGYRIGDVVSLTALTTAYPRSNFSVGTTLEAENSFELLPFIIDYSGTGTDSSDDDQLVGETAENTITIQTNLDIASDDPNAPVSGTTEPDPDADAPMEVLFELDNGVSYVDGTAEVKNYAGDAANVVFSVVSTGPATVLRWVFNEQVSTTHYRNPIEIVFDTIIDKIASATGEYVEHNQKIHTEVTVNGDYTNPNDEDCLLCQQPESVTYTQTEQNEIDAKYFTVDKWSESYLVDRQQFVRFYVQIETSSEYNLSGIEITDILPDGIDYAGEVEFNQDLRLELHEQSINAEGQPVLIWRVTDANGIPAGTSYQFSYLGKVNNVYRQPTLWDGGTRLFADDNLKHEINLRGLWGDIDPDINTGGPRTGIDEDNDTAWNELRTPTFDQGIKQSFTTSYDNEVLAGIGDTLDLYAEVTFPEFQPTNAFEYRLYLPIGTELVGDINVSSSGGFKIDPTLIKPITGGYLFEFGKVEPGSNWRVDYSVEVLDDSNLKQATKVRNLLRADYFDTRDNRITYRNELTLNIIEPNVSLTKQVATGHLAAGETAVVEIKLTNSGDDTAYGIDLYDQIPNNVELISDELTFGSNYGYAAPVHDLVNEEWQIQNIVLSPGETITISYEIETNSDIVFGDDIDSSTTVSEYSNRPANSELTARSYPQQTINSNWDATEALLTAAINSQYDPADIEVDREDDVRITYQLATTGNAPVYDAEMEIMVTDLLQLTDAITISAIVNGIQLDPTEFTYDTVTGVASINLDQLLPKDNVKLVANFTTDEQVPYDTDGLTTVTVNGKRATTDDVTANGCEEFGCDADLDDYATARVVATKLDNLAPSADIYFTEAGSSVTATNAESIDVVYRGTDQQGRVYAYQLDGKNGAYTLPQHQLLTGDELSNLGVSGQWAMWPADATDMMEQWQQLAVGEYESTLRIVDLSGNIGETTKQLLVDRTPLELIGFNISPYLHDISDPAVTGTNNNYLNIAIQDERPGNQVYVGEYRYRIFDKEWSNWQTATEGVNASSVDFGEITDGDELMASIQLRDQVGNITANNVSALGSTSEEAEYTFIDTITYQLSDPELSLTINDGDDYTRAIVNVVSATISSDSQVSEMRMGATPAAVQEADWGNDWTTKQFKFDDARNDGTKQICAQLKTVTGATSAIACDTIALDRTPPTGQVEFAAGSETSTTINEITITTQDAISADATPGSGNVQVRLSATGENCEFVTTAELTACEANWTEWSDPDSFTSWTVEDELGQQSVYAQYRDAAGNVSELIQTDIIYNNLNTTGGIIINAINSEEIDPLFTNTRYVELDLNQDIQENCPGCTGPVLMRLVQMNDQQQYPSGLQNDMDMSTAYPQHVPGSWTEWIEYHTPMQWDLDPTEESGNPDYGMKTIYVQYRLGDATKTSVYQDSIIYAPYYGIEYLRNATAEINDTANDIYGLNHVPTSVLASDEFTIKLDARNYGSFTWPATGENPVHITYKWVRTGGELPAGWTDEMVPPAERGNAAVLPEDISWNEQTGTMELAVDTPVFPGEYQLVIDTVHEGEAWFGDWGNEILEYEVSVSDNPEFPIQEPQFFPEDTNPGIGSDIPVPYSWEADGYGTNCDDINWASSYCYIRGVLNVNSNTDYQSVCASVNGGHYTHETVYGGNKYNFCFNDTRAKEMDKKVGQQLVFGVQWNSNGTYFNIDNGRIAPERKVWKSAYVTSDNPGLNSRIAVNRSSDQNKYEFTVQPKFRNIGNGIWKRGEVFLVAVDRNGNSMPSPFRASNWVNDYKVNIAANSSGWGPSTRAPFTFTISVPSDMPYGYKEQCFQVKRGGTEFERSDIWCLQLDVQMTYQEQREYFCPLPHDVYEQQDVNSDIIGQLQENDSFIVRKSEGDWWEIYLPTGDHDIGWVENDFDCFSDATVIENIIPEPEFDIIPEPEGDEGNVILLNGVEMKYGPETRFETTGFLPYGTEVQVMGETFFEDNMYGGWLLVRTADGTEGWVPKGSIWHTNDPQDIEYAPHPEMARTHVCGDGDISVHPAPGMTSRTIATIEPNQNLPVILKWQNWYKVFIDNSGNTGWINSMDGLCEGYIFPREDAFCAGELGYPYAQEYEISSDFGWRVLDGEDDYHNAVDITAPHGSNVLAVGHGRVVDASTDKYGGKFLKIYIPSQNVTVSYWHLSEIKVDSGDVFPGMIIGKTGNTGNVRPWPSAANPYAGTHLHFSVYDHAYGNYRNPLGYWNSGTCPVDEEYETQQRAMELIKAQEEEWGATNFEVSENRDGKVYEWSDSCPVWLKEYDSVDADRYSANSDWTSEEYSGGALIYNPDTDRVYLVSNGMWDKYLKEGGPCGELGLPIDTSWKNYNHEDEAGISDMSKNAGVTDGAYQRFENGSIYWHWNSTFSKGYTHAVVGEISDMYESMGGTWSDLGFPIEDEQNDCQRFQFGELCKGVDPACSTFNNDTADIKIDSAVWDYYWNNGGCEELGVPVGNLEDTWIGSSFWWGGWEGWMKSQQFSQSTIVHYEKPYGVRLSDKVNYHLSGCYEDLFFSPAFAADGATSKSYAEYLGAPTSKAGYIGSITVKNNTIYNQTGQKFNNGYIVENSGQCNVILNEWSSENLTRDIQGEIDVLAIAGQFGRGLIEGAITSIIPQDLADFFDLALDIATSLASGPLKIIFMGIQLVVGIVQILAALVENWDALAAIVEGGDLASLAYIGGTILGALVASVVIGGRIEDAISNGVKKVAKIADTVTGSLSFLKNIKLPDGFMSFIKRISGSDRFSDVADEIADRMKNIPDIDKKLVGNADTIKNLSEDEMLNIIKLIERTGKKFDVDGYTLINKALSDSNQISVDFYFENNLGRFDTKQLSLGIDPANDSFRVNELYTALNLQAKYGLSLKRMDGNGPDWVDQDGNTYDELISSTPSQHFDEQWRNGTIHKQIDNHASKADYPVIDFTIGDLTPSQRALIEQYISDHGFSDIVRIIG